MEDMTSDVLQTPFSPACVEPRSKAVARRTEPDNRLRELSQNELLVPDTNYVIKEVGVQSPGVVLDVKPATWRYRIAHRGGSYLRWTPARFRGRIEDANVQSLRL